MTYVRIDNKFKFWKTQLPVDYIDTTLTHNVWETAIANLSGGKHIKIWIFKVEQTNNGATAEDLEVEITFNGTAYLISLNAMDSAEMYYLFVTVNLTAGDFFIFHTTSEVSFGRGESIVSAMAIPFVADNASLVRVRQTSDVDVTSAQIEINISHEILVSV